MRGRREGPTMFSRFVSLALIATLAACPLSCGTGPCCADAAFETRSPASQADRVDQSAPTCCCCRETSQDDRQTPPVPGPEKFVCQGVCGGAVLEKSCEWDRFVAVFDLPTHRDDHWPVGCLPVYHRRGLQAPECVGTQNPGRLVRALNMSFLC